MTSRWQLIDRPAEFGAIRPALTGNESCGVFLVGPAGVGKTTLARTVTKSLPAKVHWVGCTESSRSIPLGVFAHLVAPSTSRDPIALMASARKSLVAQENTIIAVDDAYLLDQLSATLLHQIAIDRAGHILATVRSGEPVPDAVTALWIDGYLQRFELEPFNKEETIALVESAIGGTLEGLSADVMWESSGGNPLFLRHLVEGAIDAGTLTKVNGVWQLRGATVVPSGLAALLESRLEHAGDDVINALKPLALCEPLDIDALTELAGEECVDAAEVRGLIRIVHDGSQINARFSHPLFGEVVRRRIGTASARKLRGRIARVVSDRQLDSAAGGSAWRSSTSTAMNRWKRTCSLRRRRTRSFCPTFHSVSGSHARRSIAAAACRQPSCCPRAVLARPSGPGRCNPRAVQSRRPRRAATRPVGVPRLSYLFWSMRGDVDEAHQVLALLRERVQHPSLKLMVEAVGSAMAIHENNIAEGWPGLSMCCPTRMRLNRRSISPLLLRDWLCRSSGAAVTSNRSPPDPAPSRGPPTA